MTQKEGNILIAEFMGWTEFSTNTVKERLGVAPIRIDELKFHSSWHWLMPVIEKMQKIVIQQGHCISIEFYENFPEDPMTYVSIGDLKIKNQNPMITVWEMVVEFIKQNNDV